VAAVTVERSSGAPVVAAIQRGYFVAWWPGDAFATRMTALDGAGTPLTVITDEDWDFGVNDTPDPRPGFITPPPS
jgi:hypothetical protein